MRQSVRNGQMFISGPGRNSAHWIFLPTRRVGTPVSPSGGSHVGLTFSLGGLRSLEGLRKFNQ